VKKKEGERTPPKLQELPRGPNVLTWDNPGHFVSNSNWIEAVQEFAVLVFISAMRTAKYYLLPI